MTVFSPEVWVPLSAYDSIANNFRAHRKRQTAGQSGGRAPDVNRAYETRDERDRSGTGAKNIGRKSGARRFRSNKKIRRLQTRPVSRFSISDDPPDDSDVAAIAPLLMGMAAIVLLVACLNLANMLLARGTARRKEIATPPRPGRKPMANRAPVANGRIAARFARRSRRIDAGHLVLWTARTLDQRPDAVRRRLEWRAEACPFLR